MHTKMVIEPHKNEDRFVSSTPSKKLQSRWPWFVAMVACLVGPSSLHAQADSVELVAPTCLACTISVVRFASIGGPQSPVDIANTQAMFLVGERLFLAHFRAFGRLFEFRLDGTFVAEIGRPGEGPGEFQRVSYVHGDAAGNLHVYDRKRSSWLGRHTVLDPTGTLLRTNELEAAPFPVGTVRFEDGSYVTATHVSTSDRIGLPLQHVATDGKILRSFGSVRGEFRGDRPVLVTRLLAKGGPGRVWSAHKSRYLIEEWDTAGTRHRVRARAPDWFEPWATYRDFSRTEPPQSTIVAIHQDASGRLWVLSAVPGDSWRDGLPTRPRGEPDLSTLFDTMVDVHDADGRLLVSQHLEQSFDGFLGDGILFGSRQDDVGYVYIDLFRLAFESH